MRVEHRAPGDGESNSKVNGPILTAKSAVRMGHPNDRNRNIYTYLFFLQALEDGPGDEGEGHGGVVKDFGELSSLGGRDELAP